METVRFRLHDINSKGGLIHFVLNFAHFQSHLPICDSAGLKLRL